MKKQLNRESAIDRRFREYGEKRFGKKAMDRLSLEQVEEARCFACQVLGELTRDFGLQDKDTAEEIFCMYVRDLYLTD